MATFLPNSPIPMPGYAVPIFDDLSNGLPASFGKIPQPIHRRPEPLGKGGGGDDPGDDSSDDGVGDPKRRIPAF